MTDAEATLTEMAVKRAVDGVGGFAAEMRQKGIHVGLGFGGSPGRCVTCAEPWPCSQMDMDAAEAMNHIARAVEEAMGESINSDPNGPCRGYRCRFATQQLRRLRRSSSTGAPGERRD